MKEDSIGSLNELEDNLSNPTSGVVETLGRLDSDVLILGAGGKMGPSLSRMVRRGMDQAGVNRRVIGVSRFSSDKIRQQLENWGIETIVCDLLNQNEVASLPESSHVIYMAGFKFGSSANPAMTWAMNCYTPALVSARFRNSTLVAFSSGNVYGLVNTTTNGSVETDAPSPVGEYAITILGRERIFEYFSHRFQIPMALLRLNYATELRYGVLVDLARQIHQEKVIDLSMGYVNVIWQADANAIAIQMLEHVSTPPEVINIAGSRILNVRDTCEQLAGYMGKPVRFSGCEATDALLSNAGKCISCFGNPQHESDEMIRWTADWVLNEGEHSGKPTHFSNREGNF